MNRLLCILAIICTGCSCPVSDTVDSPEIATVSDTDIPTEQMPYMAEIDPDMLYLDDCTFCDL